MKRLTKSQITKAAAKGRKSSFGYDAVDQPKKRRQATPTMRSEDVELNPAKRRQLLAQATDCMRNMAIARWAVEKHNDFVSRFSFRCSTKTQFDYDCQELMEEWSNEKELCDIAARHPLDRIIRMTETSAVVRGDHGLLKLNSGHMQAIEGDRVRDGAGIVDDHMVHGVTVNDQSKALSYEIWRRTRYGAYELDRTVLADDMLWHAYYPTGRSDQVRGIAPISAGLNAFVDCYEWQDLTMMTAKLRTMMGIIINADSEDGLGVHSYSDGRNDDDDSPDGDGDDDEDDKPKYEVDLGPGPFKLELKKGEDLKFVTDLSPSQNTFEFYKAMIGIALKSLDIPLSFYDEGLTNFFGNRAALILYLESVKSKRKNLVSNILRPMTKWKIGQWVAQKRLRVPPNGNINKVPFAWHPAGVPYWNPSQEINADIQAIQAGLGNWEDIYLERTGRDWFADMLRRKEQTDFLEKNKILLDPKVIQILQVMSDPSNAGSNPLSTLPVGVAV